MRESAVGMIAVAPMMDWTDRHCRYFLRLLSPSALLYTEMVTAAAVVHGDADRLLRFNDEEHPVAGRRVTVEVRAHPVRRSRIEVFDQGHGAAVGEVRLAPVAVADEVGRTRKLMLLTANRRRLRT